MTWFRNHFFTSLHIRLQEGVPPLSISGAAFHYRSVFLRQLEGGEALHTCSLNFLRIPICLIHLCSHEGLGRHPRLKCRLHCLAVRAPVCIVHSKGIPRGKPFLLGKHSVDEIQNSYSNQHIPCILYCRSKFHSI